jgi:nucleotide-binding universal stress UspA family protein
VSASTHEHHARTVVLGDDGTSAADLAWLWLNNHRWPGWRLECVTAIEPMFGPEAATALTESSPQWERRPFTEAEFTSVRRLQALADPRVLLEERDDADLIVVGAHHHKLRLGSTTEWLLHHPPAPLAIIRAGVATRDVLFCTDGSRHAQRALEVFVSLPWASDTHVTVAVVDDGHTDVDAALEQSSAVLDPSGISTSVERLQGRPRHALPAYLGEQSPHLTVAGTRGLTGWRRLRLGSTAAAMVHATPGSVLLACSGDEEHAD